MSLRRHDVARQLADIDAQLEAMRQRIVGVSNIVETVQQVEREALHGTEKKAARVQASIETQVAQATPVEHERKALPVKAPQRRVAKAAPKKKVKGRGARQRTSDAEAEVEALVANGFDGTPATM